MNKEKEAIELEELLDSIELEDEELLPDSEYDSLSDKYCDTCPARLTKEEFELYESQCSDCIHEETSGIILDSPEDELT